MEEENVKAGQIVRFFSSRVLAKVLEIDSDHAVRVKLMDTTDTECWANLDQLEVVELVEPRGRIEYRSAGVDPR